MPARPRWLLALPDAIEQLERIARARDAVRARARGITGAH